MKRKAEEEAIEPDEIPKHHKQHPYCWMLQYSAQLTHPTQITPNMLVLLCPIAKRCLFIIHKTLTIRRRNGKVFHKGKIWMQHQSETLLDGFMKEKIFYIMDCIQWKGHNISSMPFKQRIEYLYMQLKQEVSVQEDEYEWRLVPILNQAQFMDYRQNIPIIPLNKIELECIKTCDIGQDELDGYLFIDPNAPYIYSENGLNQQMLWCKADRFVW